MNTSHLFLSSWLWSSLLISCASIFPALGGQSIPSTASVETTYPSNSSILIPSLDSSRNLSSNEIAKATSAEPKAIPTVWASQSLARLMDQHDCPMQSAVNEPLSINGGLRQVNRYKIATQLFSCLEQWDQQAFDIQEQATLKALRSEFKLELVALQGYSASGSVISANIPRESIGSLWNPQISDSVASSNTIEYRQSVEIASQGRVAMGLNYTDRAIDSPHNLLGINAEVSLGRIGLFGRYSTALGTQPRQTDRSPDELASDRSMQSWTAGIGVQDFMIQRSVLVVSVTKSIQPSSFTQPAQINYGAFYQFPVTERLTLSPSVVITTHPEKSGATPDVQGALQASFSF